ncbi:MAG: transposase [Gammaproteobacteria bacterium]|nr:transposase [Gammaproteobacteria bacterium]
MAHRSRGAVPGRCVVLVTLRVLHDVPPLRRGCFVRAFRETLRACRNRPGFRVAHYSIQDDHAHFLIEAAGARRLANGMKSLAARFARCVNAGVAAGWSSGARGAFWRGASTTC